MTVLRPEYPLHTERLQLRPYRQTDLDALYDIQRRPEVTRYLYWSPRSRDEVREMLTRRSEMSAIANEGDGLLLAAELRGSGQLVGDVALQWHSQEHRQGEIGFVLHPDHQGRGYASEAASVMLRLGFEGLGLHRIVGRADGRNAASLKVLTRLGMRREAHLVENEFVKGEWTDEVIYALLDREWQQLTDRPGARPS
jgi:RimJ/RimL family protein N-acetyltransferase